MQDHVGLISYAQNREDIYLWALVGHRTPGTYVDVGCNDEQVGSVTRMFYDLGWSGLDIDADPKYRAGYSRRKRDAFLAIGISDEPGEHTFRIYPDKDGLATFDAATMREHETAGLESRDVTVPVRTLDQVLEEHGIGSIDFLKIDVEGLEPAVLRSIDLDLTRPAVIVIEASRIEECDEILTAKRYHREFFDGLNLYYADGDADDINILNFAARVLHGGYQTVHEHELRKEVEWLRARGAVEEADPRPEGSASRHPDGGDRSPGSARRVAAAVRRRLRR